MNKSRKNAFANRRISKTRMSGAKKDVRTSLQKLQRISGKVEGFRMEVKDLKAAKSVQGTRTVDDVNLDIMDHEDKLERARREHSSYMNTYKAYLKKNRDLDKKGS